MWGICQDNLKTQSIQAASFPMLDEAWGQLQIWNSHMNLSFHAIKCPCSLVCPVSCRPLVSALCGCIYFWLWLVWLVQVGWFIQFALSKSRANWSYTLNSLGHANCNTDFGWLIKLQPIDCISLEQPPSILVRLLWSNLFMNWSQCFYFYSCICLPCKITVKPSKFNPKYVAAAKSCIHFPLASHTPSSFDIRMFIIMSCLCLGMGKHRTLHCYAMNKFY